MIPRLRAITLLLATSERYLDDFMPRGAQFASQSGPGPAKKERCRRCEGLGKTKGNARCGMCHVDGVGSHGCEQCKECKGRGHAWYDDYLQGARDDKLSPQLVESPPEKQKRTAGGKARKRTIEPKGLDATIHRVAAARYLQEKSGSYKALDRAMKRLQIEDEVAAYLLRAHYVENRWGVPEDMAPKPPAKAADLPLEHERAILRGLTLLSEWLPRTLNLPSDVLVKELDQGQKVPQLQKQTGLSRRAVRRARRVA